MVCCCTGSQRIIDSDFSDFDVDDGIGVVPPGALVTGMVPSSLCFLLRFTNPDSSRMFILEIQCIVETILIIKNII